MLTLFTIPKPFRGHIAVIQRNAIHSWTLLQPACEIILFGDDEGTAEAAADFGVRHVPKVARNEFGTPLVNDLFCQTKKLATNECLCYVNADIILMSDFMRAVQHVVSWSNRFLIIGQRWDVDIREPLDFENKEWEKRLVSYVSHNGVLHAVTGIDYFVFKGLYKHVPPFAIGRTAWDNWLVYHAKSLMVPIVDATRAVVAVHQNHDYSHHPSGTQGVWKGPEAIKNRELAGPNSIATIEDSTHRLCNDGRVKKVRFKREKYIWKKAKSLWNCIPNYL